MARIKLSLVVSLLASKVATTSMDSITSDVQVLPSPSVESFARVVVVNYLSSATDFHDWKCSPGWESRLGEPCQLSTVAAPMIAVRTGQRRI